MTDIAAVERILKTEPIWSAYALADLHPDFAPYCTWYVGEKEQGRSNVERAVALVFTGLQIPTLFLAGSVAAAEIAVRQMMLPAEVYITIREHHFPVVQTLWDFTGDTRRMWRLALPATTELVKPQVPGMVRLKSDDSSRLRALYDHGGPFAPDAFSPYQVDNGVFYGIEAADGALLAAGGTHIVNWECGIGAIGNMYTRPDQRGRGHASAILGAIVNALRSGRVDNIVLNVDRRNAGARRIYERHGFVIHCAYYEGVGQRKGTDI